MPYLGPLSQRISRILKISDYRPAYYTVNSLKQIVSHLKDPTPFEEKSGVYSLKCSDCPAVYVGQTGRKLLTRVAEHEKAAARNTPEKSAFAAHLTTTGHSFDRQEGLRLLHCESTGKRLTALENLEIIKATYNPRINVVNDVIPISPLAESVYGTPARD